MATGMAAHERVVILLSLLGAQQRVALPAGDVEAVGGKETPPRQRHFVACNSRSICLCWRRSRSPRFSENPTRG